MTLLDLEQAIAVRELEATPHLPPQHSQFPHVNLPHLRIARAILTAQTRIAVRWTTGPPARSLWKR
jgi:hypothetical protein